MQEGEWLGFPRRTVALKAKAGRGLGLAIAQKIAEAHDTTIDVDVAQNRKSISFSV